MLTTKRAFSHGLNISSYIIPFGRNQNMFEVKKKTPLVIEEVIAAIVFCTT